MASYVSENSPSLFKKAKAAATRVLSKKAVRQLIAIRKIFSDIPAFAYFLFNQNLGLTLKQRLSYLYSLLLIDRNVECPHLNSEILTFASIIFQTGRTFDGLFLEAGCFKGGSTAKFSLACSMVNKNLLVYDSFCGLPDTKEQHGINIFGSNTKFKKGDFCGAIDEVKRNVGSFGRVDFCHFVEGYFEDTLPDLEGSIIAAYVDVDLASSTRECLKYIYPRIVKDGFWVSQDGHLPLVLRVYDDAEFWLSEVGEAMPQIDHLGKKKLLVIKK